MSRRIGRVGIVEVEGAPAGNREVYQLVDALTGECVQVSYGELQTISELVETHHQLRTRAESPAPPSRGEDD